MKFNFASEPNKLIAYGHIKMRNIRNVIIIIIPFKAYNGVFFIRNMLKIERRLTNGVDVSIKYKKPNTQSPQSPRKYFEKMREEKKNNVSNL